MTTAELVEHKLVGISAQFCDAMGVRLTDNGFQSQASAEFAGNRVLKEFLEVARKGGADKALAIFSRSDRA